MTRYAGSFVSRRTGMAPVTCFWISPRAPPNRLLPAAITGGRIPLSSSTSGCTHPVGMAPMVRRIDDPIGTGRGPDVVDALAGARDLAEQGIKRMLKGAVHPVPLCGPKLVQVAVNGGARLIARQPAATLEIPNDLFAGEHGLRDLVLRHAQQYSTGRSVASVHETTAERSRCSVAPDGPSTWFRPGASPVRRRLRPLPPCRRRPRPHHQSPLPCRPPKIAPRIAPATAPPPIRAALSRPRERPSR